MGSAVRVQNKLRPRRDGGAFGHVSRVRAAVRPRERGRERGRTYGGWTEWPTPRQTVCPASVRLSSSPSARNEPLSEWAASGVSRMCRMQKSSCSEQREAEAMGDGRTDGGQDSTRPKVDGGCVGEVGEGAREALHISS